MRRTKRRSRLDRRAAELLALRRAGATLAQMTRWLRFSRLAVSRLAEHGYFVLRLRADGATIGECRSMLRDEHGLLVDRSTVSR